VGNTNNIGNTITLQLLISFP